MKNIIKCLTLLLIILLTPFANKAAAQPINVAEVVHAQGEVRLKSTTVRKWIDVEVGMKVKEGDTIKTGTDSRAELAFGKNLKNIINVFSNSQLTVTKFQPGVINLTEGRVFTLIEKLDKGSTFEVRTPTAIAGARGTGWETAAQRRQKRTVVKGFERKVYIAGLDKKGRAIGKIDLKPGFRSVIERQKRPGIASRLTKHEKRQWRSWEKSAKRRVKEFKKKETRKSKPKPKDKGEVSAKVQPEAKTKLKPQLVDNRAKLKTIVDKKTIQDKLVMDKSKGLERKIITPAPKPMPLMRKIDKKEKRLIAPTRRVEDAARKVEKTTKTVERATRKVEKATRNIEKSTKKLETSIKRIEKIQQRASVVNKIEKALTHTETTKQSNRTGQLTSITRQVTDE